MLNPEEQLEIIKRGAFEISRKKKLYLKLANRANEGHFPNKIKTNTK